MNRSMILLMNRILEYVMMAGGLVLLVGVVLKMFAPDIAPVIYLAGALSYFAGQIPRRYDGDSMVIRRLHGQQVLGAFFLVLSAVLMYAEKWRPSIVMNTEMPEGLHRTLVSLTAPNSWIVFMAIAAVFELYSSLRIGYELKKEENIK